MVKTGHHREKDFQDIWTLTKLFEFHLEAQHFQFFLPNWHCQDTMICILAQYWQLNHLEIFMLGHDGDLVAIHTQDFTLKVYQLPLTHFHIISCLEIVLTLLTCINKTFVINFAKLHAWKDCSIHRYKKNIYCLDAFTCCLCDYFKVNPLWLVLKLLQFWQSGFDPFCDLCKKRHGLNQ